MNENQTIDSKSQPLDLNVNLHLIETQDDEDLMNADHTPIQTRTAAISKWITDHRCFLSFNFVGIVIFILIELYWQTENDLLPLKGHIALYITYELVLCLIFDIANMGICYSICLLTLALFQIVDDRQLYSGFGDESVIACACLLCLALAVEQSTLFGYFIMFLGKPTTIRQGLIRLLPFCVLLSFFFDPFALVPILTPLVEAWARSCNLAKTINPIRP
jgi:hypothetical protein